MAFDLSPSVSVREINLTGYVPNIPSAKTGMVLRSNKGPCLDITPITNEAELIKTFGKPTAGNYQDWFQAWNFLQYAASLYIVRPMDTNTITKNAGIGMSGDVVSSDFRANLYNSAVAEHTLANLSGTSETLYLYNRNITSDQRYAVAVVSSPENFKSSIGLEYQAIVTNTDGSETVSAAGQPTLTTGSLVKLNGNKLAKVTSIINSSSSASTITFDRSVSADDVVAFYAVAASGNTTGLIAYFKKEGFSLKVGAVISNDYVVQKIEEQNLTYKVTFSSTQANYAVSADAIVTSEEVRFSATTSYNPKTSDFGVSAGDSVISVAPGFIMQPGVKFTLSGSTQEFIVSSFDTIANTITLVSPSDSSITSASPIEFTVIQPTVNNIIIGINFFDRVYDSSLIQKTKLTLKDASNNDVTIIAQSLITFNKIFDFPPTWSNKEFGLVVLQKNDSGLYEKSEVYTVSYDSTSKDVTGVSNFVENVLFKSSSAIYAKVGNVNGQPVETANIVIPKIVSDTLYGTTIYPQKGGSSYDQKQYDETKYTQGDIDQAFALFAEPETFDVNILICNEKDSNYASTIAETRKDCVAIVVPFDGTYLSQNSSTQCTEWLLNNYGSQTVYDGKIFTSFGTYSAFYGNMKYQYDKFNNVNRWINVAGDIAGLYAQTDSTNDPWYAPAGTTRGVIKNAIKLAFNPTKANRDELYVNSINPIMAIPGEGSAIVWGQKTATATPSAFDRVNVRRLLIHLEKSISTAANIGLFEFNDAFTRSRLFNIIDPFLRSVQNRRGLYAYKVIVDESNNTSQVIDQNGLIIDIYLQPTKVAEFIRVNAIVTPTGANFQEYVGKF